MILSSLVCSRCRRSLSACIGLFQVRKPYLNRLRPTLEGKQSSNQTGSRDSSTDSQVDVKRVNIGLPYKQLLIHSKAKDGRGGAVEIIQLSLTQHIGQRLLDFIVENDKTSRNSHTAAENPQLHDDSLYNGYIAPISPSSAHVTATNISTTYRNL